MMTQAKARLSSNIKSMKKSRKGSSGYGNVSRLHGGGNKHYNNGSGGSSNKLEFTNDISSAELCEKVGSKKLIIIMIILWM